MDKRLTERQGVKEELGRQTIELNLKRMEVEGIENFPMDDTLSLFNKTCIPH